MTDWLIRSWYQMPVTARFPAGLAPVVFHELTVQALSFMPNGWLVVAPVIRPALFLRRHPPGGAPPIPPVLIIDPSTATLARFAKPAAHTYLGHSVKAIGSFHPYVDGQLFCGGVRGVVATDSSIYVRLYDTVNRYDITYGPSGIERISFVRRLGSFGLQPAQFVASLSVYRPSDMCVIQFPDGNASRHGLAVTDFRDG